MHLKNDAGEDTCWEVTCQRVLKLRPWNINILSIKMIVWKYHENTYIIGSCIFEYTHLVKVMATNIKRPDNDV